MGYRGIKKTKKDNRGFTLVEVLVAVALVAVVGTAVFGFMTVGARTFSTTSSDVNLQSESQLAFNQMQDIIIDTAIGIDYGYLPDGSILDAQDYRSYTGSWVTSIPAGTACAAKKLVMYNIDRVYEITWVGDEERLYYTEYSAHDENGEVVRDSVVDGPALMAEYISDFNADLSLMQSKRIVRLETTYEKGGQDYISSHNITLRNKPLSGNSIPTYMQEEPDSELKGIIGNPDIYIKPGERLDMMSHKIVKPGEDILDVNGSVLVPAASAGAYSGYLLRYDDYDSATGKGFDFPNQAPGQRLLFTVKSGQSGYVSNLEPDTGILTISPAQTNDFEITVSGSYGIYTKVKKVHVHILRVSGITMTFEGDDSTAFGGEGSVSQNGLKTDEEFIIKASVSAYNGITNEVSDVSGTGINYSVSWDKTKGEDLFDTTGSATGPDSSNTSSCRFKMNEVTEDNALIQITATSVESVNQGYQTRAGVEAPVKGSIDCHTYKEPEDPGKKIVPDPDSVPSGDFERGAQYVVNLTGIHKKNDGSSYQNQMEKQLALEDGSTLDLKGCIKVIELHAYETEYMLDSTGTKAVPKGAEFEITDLIKSDDEILIKEDANWRFCAPMWYSPNSKYRYVIQHKVIANPDPTKSDDYDYKWYTLKDAEDLYTARGLNINGKDRNGDPYIKANGPKLDVTFNRLTIKYLRDNDTPSNYYTYGESKADNVKYYPRHFNKQQPPNEFMVYYDMDKSFKENGKISNKDIQFTKFMCYKPNGNGIYEYGSKVTDSLSVANEYREINLVNEDGNSPDEKILVKMNDVGSKGNISTFGNAEVWRNKMQFKGFSSRNKVWETVEKQFRMLPIVTIAHGNENRYNGDYILLDNYIEVNTWNINIPSDGYIAKLLKIDDGIAAERSYFPLPTDNLFPGKDSEQSKINPNTGLRYIGRIDDELTAKNDKETWVGCKEWSGSCCNYTNWSHPEMVWYSLEEHANADGTKYWDLMLFAKKKGTSNEIVAFQSYTCDENGTEWYMTSKLGSGKETDKLPIFQVTSGNN